MLQDYLNREHRALWGIVSNGHRLRLLRDASSPHPPVLRRVRPRRHLHQPALRRLPAVLPHRPRQPIRTPARRNHHDGTDRHRRGRRRGRRGRHPDARTGELLARAMATSPPSTTAPEPCSTPAARRRRRAAAAGHRFLVPPRQHRAARDARCRSRCRPRPASRAAAHRLPADRVVRRRRPRPAAPAARRPRSPQALRRATSPPRGCADWPPSHIGGRHTDLWEAHQIVTDALAGDGLPTLGLGGLGATLYSRDTLSILDGARLPNRRLARRGPRAVPDRRPGHRQPRARSTTATSTARNSAACTRDCWPTHPRYNADDRTFTLEIATGNERKKSGSYYTPSDLIAPRPRRSPRPADRRGRCAPPTRSRPCWR